MSQGFDQILKDPTTRQLFCDWFWCGTNGNNLINQLNQNNAGSTGSRIRRRHECWPHIYCIVLNDNQNPGKGEQGIQWRYCKVGMTEVGTAPGSGNRMERVQEEIHRRTGRGTSIIFVLPVKATDSRSNIDIENYVRDHVGIHVDKEIARSQNFPVPTEWVITTQPCLGEIQRLIHATPFPDTGLFANFKHPQTAPPLPQTMVPQSAPPCIGTNN